MNIIRCDRCGKQELDDGNVKNIFHVELLIKHLKTLHKDLCANCLGAVTDLLCEKLPEESKE